MQLGKFCFLFFSCLSFTLAAQNIKDSTTGTEFPDKVTFDHEGKTYDLTATGVSTRKKLFIKVYSVAHYLQDAQEVSGDIFQYLVKPNKAKQLTLKWLLNAPRDKVIEGYHESFKKALTSDQLTNLQPSIDKFLGLFQSDITKGEEHTFRWIPEGLIEVIINGKSVGNVNNPEFASALWTLWFGEKSAVNRDNLVSLVKAGSIH